MSEYHESQDLVARAEAALRGGEIEEARRLFRAAAGLQKRLVDRVPPERVRTRSVFGLSAASLLFKGDALDEAEALVYGLLANGPLEPRSRDGLRELLQRIWNERRASEAGLPGAGEVLSAVLSGGRVQHGLAPLDLIDTVVRTLTSLIRRMGAWCNRQPFALRPAPAVRDIGESYRVLMSEPIYGSYRIDLYLAQEQPSLDLGTQYGGSATPTQIIDSCLHFARLVASNDRDSVEALVTDERYRGALLRLVRQLVPDGRDVAEVEIRTPTEPRELAVRLRPIHSGPVSRLIETIGPQAASETGGKLSTLAGALRAVDLDARRLKVHHADRDTDIRFSDQLHDILAPMLNREVVVFLVSGRSGQTPLAWDIEFAHQYEFSAAG